MMPIDVYQFRYLVYSKTYKVFPNMPAWWPGGLTAQNAFLYYPFMIPSHASITAPQDSKLHSQVLDDKEVSW